VNGETHCPDLTGRLSLPNFSSALTKTFKFINICILNKKMKELSIIAIVIDKFVLGKKEKEKIWNDNYNKIFVPKWKKYSKDI
jgi:hypothetical protein